jgi:hypothetical protein
LPTIYFFQLIGCTSQIYEEKVLGIVGYRDENGETIYEGFDEGPRLAHEELEKINNER